MAIRNCARLCLILWGVSFAWVLSLRTVLAAEPSLISIDDLYRFDSPQGLVVARDGESGFYSRRWADRAARTVRFSLWRTNRDGANRRALEEGEPDARAPLLSPDGKWIAFLSTRQVPFGNKLEAVPPYSDPATDLWLIPASGGKAIPLAGNWKPYGRVFNDPFFGNVAFSPDGRKLAFIADDTVDPRTPAEIANNVQVVREDQGEGYEGYRSAQVWVADLLDQPADAAASKVSRVTNDNFWYGDPQWMPDGQSLIVHANRTEKRESVRFSINQNFDLWRVSLKDGAVSQLTSGPGPEISPRLAPDGRTLVCLSSPRSGSHMDVFNLTEVNLSDGGLNVHYDHHGPQSESPPYLAPAFPLARDCWLTPTTLYFNAPDKTTNRVQVVDLSIRPVTAGNLPPKRVEPYTKLVADRRQLTPPADPFLKERVVAKSELVTWKAADELEIEGIFTRPTTPNAKPPFKTVVHPHGGPHSRSVVGFDFTVQVLAAHGYAVFQPNFRGSAGYGQKFIDADRFDLGGKDMTDILTGVDHLIKAGLIDSQRQFLYGISYGGFTTSWLIGQTNQFRAAVPQNAVTDLTMMWGLSDIQSWTEWEFGGRPWEVPQAMRDHSPLTFASRVKTPTLILHAANDRRCPLPMGRMYYRALKSAGVETEMVIYPDEGHPIRQLPHQEDVLTRVLDWFARHGG